VCSVQVRAREVLREARRKRRGGGQRGRRPLTGCQTGTEISKAYQNGDGAGGGAMDERLM
jgi:hypothetical protein